MNQDASVAIAITARNQASETLRQVKQGTADVGQQMESTRTTARSASGVFGGLGRQLVGMAAGFVGVTAVARGVITAMSDTAKATATARTVAEQYGPAAVLALEAAQAQAGDLAREFATTESVAIRVFTTLLRETRDPERALARLGDTMTIARAHGLGFEEAAGLMAQAIRGNHEPLIAAIGLYGDLDQAVQIARRHVQEAITPTERLGSAFSRIFEGFAQSQVMKDFTTSMEAVGRFLNPPEITKVGGILRTRTQAIQQVQIYLQAHNIVMSEDQQREFVRRVQQGLDENARRGG